MTSANTARKTSKGKGNKTRTTKTPAKRPTRYDWDSIRTAFIEGMPVPDGGQFERTFHTQKEIAELFDVPYQRVRERASQERWTELRHKEQIEVAAKRQKERSEKILGDALDFDEKTLKVAQVGINLITARLGEIASDVKDYRERRAEAIEKMKRGEKVEAFELYSAVNYREMESLASAAARFQEIGNKALGIDVQRHEISGPGGGPLQVDGVSVGEELLRDDPERMTAVLAAAIRAGIDVGELTAKQADTIDEEETGDGEKDVVEGDWYEGDEQP